MDGRPLNGAGRANRLLVLGIGSRLMRDDGVGPALIDAMQQEPCPNSWLLCAAETDLLYAAELRQAGDYIVLIDAVQTGSTPGTVYMVELETQAWCKSRPASLHGQDAWKMVFEKPHSGGCLIGVEVSDISPGIGLSNTLNSFFPEICRRVKAQLIKIGQNKLYPVVRKAADKV